jgi:mono/diheme cytochrome c family protein
MTGPVRQVIVAAALAVGAAACDEKLSDVAGPTPDLAPTLSSIQREIFNTTDSSGRQACIQCHTDNGRTPAGGLVLLEGRSHGAIVGVGSRQKVGAVIVVPGDPDGSYLIHKIEGRGDIIGQRMPRTGGPYLTEGQVRIIRRWIELGARND